MVFDRFTADDIAPFLEMAVNEGWLCDRWEFEFLLRQFPKGCFVIRQSGGAPLAFVTAISYTSSGWIGNLVVSEAMRRKGLGSIIMEKALDALAAAGVRTIWLTASAQGAPLYARMGFRGIDRILRWRIDHALSADGYPENDKSTDADDFTQLIHLDSNGWGDDRRLICSEKRKLGKLFSNGTSSLVIHETSAGVQIGPWVSREQASAKKLLESIFDTRLHPGMTFFDIPAGNSRATALLDSFGFSQSGETVLMYKGEPPEYHPEYIFALASMGSMG